MKGLHTSGVIRPSAVFTVKRAAFRWVQLDVSRTVRTLRGEAGGVKLAG